MALPVAHRYHILRNVASAAADEGKQLHKALPNDENIRYPMLRPQPAINDYIRIEIVK